MMRQRFIPQAETYNASRAYVTMNGTNLATTYGMLLMDYSVGIPVPLLKLINVPGKPGMLDATLALNGKVNYTSRPITAKFHVRNNTYSNFHTLLSTLLPLFNGTESKVVFSTDPNWYYKGRFTIDTEKSNPISSNFVISCSDAFPYKLEVVTVEGTSSSSAIINCVGKDYNSALTINASAVMQVSFGGNTYQLVSGNNMIRELHLVKGNNYLNFTGSGTVRITYERGIL